MLYIIIIYIIIILIFKNHKAEKFVSIKIKNKKIKKESLIYNIVLL